MSDYVDTATGPVYVPPDAPAWEQATIIEAAGGLAVTPDTPVAASGATQASGASDAPPASSGGTYVVTVTGPVYVPDDVPQWVKDELVDQAGGLPPVVTPPPAVTPPRPNLDITKVEPIPAPTTAPARDVVPGGIGSTPGATRIEGVFTAPPGGLPLSGDFAAIGRSLGAGLLGAQPGELPDDDKFNAMITTWLEGLGITGGLANIPGETMGRIASAYGKVLQLQFGDETKPNPGAPYIGLTPLITGDFAQSLIHNSDIGDTVASVIREGIEPAFGALQTDFEGIFSDVHQAVIAELQTGDASTIEGADARAARAVEIAFGAGFGAHGISVLLELLHPLKNMGFGQLAGLVAEAAGFGPIADALWISLIRPAIRRPLDSLYNQQFPTEEPGIIDVLGFARRHEYDGTEGIGALQIPQGFVDAMSRHGYSQANIESFYSHVFQVPRLYDVIRLADVLLEPGPPPDAIVQQLIREGTNPSDPLWFTDFQLRQAGYASWTVDLYKQAIVHRADQSDRERQLRELEAQLREGYTTEDAYRAVAQGYGVRASTIDFNVSTAKLTRAATYWGGLEDQWNSAFQKNQISEDELRTNLAVFIVDPVELDMKVNVQVMKRDIATRQKATAAEEKEAGTTGRLLVTAYRQQYRAGLIDGPTLTNAIIAAGFTTAYAATVAYSEGIEAEAKALTKKQTTDQANNARFVELFAQAYDQQYADDLLTLDQLKHSFEAVGMDPRVAAARAAKDSAKKVSTALRLANETSKKEAAAETTTEKQQARSEAQAAKVQYDQLSAAFLAHQRALHTAGDITTDQMYEALLLAGWSQPLAAELAATAAAQKKEGPWQPSPEFVGGTPAPAA